MNGYGLLALGLVLFVGGHLALSHPPLRRVLIARLGEGGFLGGYSLVAAAGLLLLAQGWRDAEFIALWPPVEAARGFALITAVAGFAVIGMALRPDNPTLTGSRVEPERWIPTGAFAITRHPMMWGIALWAIGHIAINGDLASLVLFGGLLTLALVGAAHSDARRARADPVGFSALAMRTSFWPFAALAQGRARMTMTRIDWLGLVAGGAGAGVVIALHGLLFGVPAAG